MEAESTKQKKEFKSIKLFLSDVDGVMTDGSMYYSADGNEFKRFSTYDGMAFQILKEKNIRTGMITSENTKIVEFRARKLNVDYVIQGVKNIGKLQSAKEICKELGIGLSEVAYIGDDINCLELLKEVGFAGCPSNAVKQIKELNNIIYVNCKGGEGAVRAFVEYLICEHII